MCCLSALALLLLFVLDFFKHIFLSFIYFKFTFRISVGLFYVLKLCSFLWAHFISLQQGYCIACSTITFGALLIPCRLAWSILWLFMILYKQRAKEKLCDRFVSLKLQLCGFVHSFFAVVVFYRNNNITVPCVMSFS